MTEPSPLTVETEGRVGIVRLNRPRALNALSDAMMAELGRRLRDWDADPAVGAIVLTGDDRAFAAGADVREMRDRRFPDTAVEDFIAPWEAASQLRKPLVAAVSGFALGGGCELAMMADIVIAGPDAVFGQPEAGLGIIPGAGGTQRLTRAVGKALAMDMVLTGRRLSAREAERHGLVARVSASTESLVPEATAMAARIAALSPAVAVLAKQAVNRAFETTLAEGVRHERALFLSLFGTPHQREGMAAFLEKRDPDFFRNDGGANS